MGDNYGWRFQQTEPNEVQGRAHHQWSQFPFLQVSKQGFYGSNEVK